MSRIFAPEVAAAAFRLHILAEALAQLGAEVDVVTTRPPAGSTIADGGLRVRRWPALRDASGNIRGYVQYLSFDVPLILRILTRRVDLTVVEPPPTTGAVVRVVSACQRRPYAYYAGDIWSDGAASMGAPRLVVAALRLIEAWVLRGAVRVLCVSEDVARRVMDLGVEQGRCLVVGNGVDIDVFNPDGDAVPDAPEFVYAGTMSEWQGADVFVSALARVRERFPTARLAFLGQGSAEASLRARVERECPGAVRFLGLVPPAECARWLRGAKGALVSITPNIGYDFAKPTKIYAALSCGTPVVFAGIGAAQELVRSHQLGWAPGYAVDDVAAAMTAVLLRPDSEVRQMSEHCVRWASAHASLRGQGLAAARALCAEVSR